MTREQGNQPATRADLAKVRTELESLRTEITGDTATQIKESEERIKSDLKTEFKTTIAAAIKQSEEHIKLAVQWQFNKFEDRLRAEINEGARKTQNIIDSFLRKLETYGNETLTFPKTLDEHGKTLKNHESRISVLEAPR